MNYFESITNDISQIIKFKSVQAPAKEGMPFGQGAADCLKYYLDLAQKLGFETTNYDNYVGEVKFGSGKDFAVLAHLDVVPEGSGWNHDPFGGEIDTVNQKIWGRGTTDDKGPAIIALYALYNLKESGYKPTRTIKIIVGCNEETGWACIDHYNKVATMPEEGISPDADFPVIYAEKGIAHLCFEFPANGVTFSNLNGGNLSNMVCDYCSVNAAYDGAKAKLYGIERDGDKLVTRGKSAHGSTPEKGINAMPSMLKYLGLDGIYTMLFERKFDISALEDETGKLTISPNLIKQEGDSIFVTCDIRYPATYTRDKVLAIIDNCGIKYTIVHDQAPLYNDKNSHLIQTLLKVYNEVTGKSEQPIAIGGGTYARALKFGAAFGPEEEGDEATIHQANEYISFDKIKKCFEIYTRALKSLCFE
jgi:succinyl-diaminopimelate desuccinylase